MKTTKSFGKVACLGALGGATAALLFVCLLALLLGIWVYRTFTSAAVEFNRSPFAPAPDTAAFNHPPGDVHIDMQTVPVRDSSDTADEKQALSRIETQLQVSQAAVFQATWSRLVESQNPQRCTFTYFRNDMRLSYEVAGQPKLLCDGVTFANFMGMAHGVNSSITRDMRTLNNRNANLPRRN